MFFMFFIPAMVLAAVSTPLLIFGRTRFLKRVAAILVIASGLLFIGAVVIWSPNYIALIAGTVGVVAVVAGNLRYYLGRGS